ncbi:nitrous oxide reductase family maturation protein NosD [Rudanella paleaurantiibacter]|uniref:Nitrous oxide reductase family maturation protein NosD n=1 Tax=Rudanella paleaurantiibacter TaxID=2614655 RepID=A0A7J5TT57_9BACT|nr:nitrous oxide reductase family maturation protein NosD [Rudanella paleaurantiibacter]KAB7726821.1 nitrous oxide reductase family maturation protein NosD [Rudanella paleaurantiibacter]
MKLLRYVLLLLFPLLASARTVVVGPSGPVHTIRQGLAQAAPFDTLLIQKGLYREINLMVDKPLVILGQNYPVVDGEKKGEIFTIRAADVTVQGLELRNVGRTSTIDWAAVKILSTRRVRVVGNRIRNAYFGVYMSASDNCLVRQNDIAGSPQEEQTTGNAIHAWKCDSLTILNNHIRGHRDGIYFEFVTHSTIRQNYSHGNIRYGLHFMFSHENSYFYNTFRENGAGVAVMYTRKVIMRHNHFEQNWGSAAYGLLLKDISDSQIEQNTFRKNTVGIHMEGTSRINCRNNRLTENGWGMRIQASCNDNVFSQNTFIANTFDVATNGTTVFNTFDRNYWDKYEGYDLNRDGRGDVPYHPVSLYSMIIEQMPHGVVLLRSFIVTLLDRAEKVIPSLTPEALVDANPLMKQP